MADYLSQHTGEQLDTAVQKALDITSTPANIDAAVAQELATADYVVESGVSGNWHYIKFASGQAVLWGIHSVTPTSSTAVGSLYYSESIVLSTPFGVQNAVVSGSGNALMWTVSAGSSYQNSTIDFRLMRASAIPTTANSIKISVWGLWR